MKAKETVINIQKHKQASTTTSNKKRKIKYNNNHQ